MRVREIDDLARERRRQLARGLGRHREQRHVARPRGLARRLGRDEREATVIAAGQVADRPAGARVARRAVQARARVRREQLRELHARVPGCTEQRDVMHAMHRYAHPHRLAQPRVARNRSPASLVR
jgi:hypothetical protein